MEVKKIISQTTLVYGGTLLLTLSIILFSSKAFAQTIDYAPKDSKQESYFDRKTTTLIIDTSRGTKVVYTKQTILKDALSEAGIELNGSIFVKPLEDTILTGGKLNVTIDDADIPLTIIDQGIRHEVMTSKNTDVQDILQAYHFDVDPKDLILPGLATFPTATTTITITRSNSININFKNQQYNFHTFAPTIHEVLKEFSTEKKIPLEELLTHPDGPLVSGHNISIKSSEVREVVEESSIEPPTTEVDDYNILVGQTSLIIAGTPGILVKKYSVRYEDGQEISRDFISEEVKQEPVNRKIAVGKKVEERQETNDYQSENIPEQHEEPIIEEQPPIVYQPGTGDVGEASWYSYGSTPTCAHRDYPRGTQLLVTNNETGAQVVVTVNDYGPAEWTNRIIDLNSVAFSSIGPLSQGVMEVTVTPI